MGQHKYNPVAQAAKEGKLPPKPREMSTAKLRALTMAELERKTGADRLIAVIKENKYV